MLDGIQYGRLHITTPAESKEKEGQTFTFGRKEKLPHEPEASIVVHNPAVWLRLCSNLDAVRGGLGNS
jgi:hypothetical protein